MTSTMQFHDQNSSSNNPPVYPEHKGRQQQRRFSLLWVVTGGILSTWIATKPFVLALLLWTTAQWIPIDCNLKTSFQNTAWHIWNDHYDNAQTDNGKHTILDVPVLDVSQPLTLHDVDEILGTDWRSKPLYLKNLWNHEQLHHNASRRLSVQGLLKESLEIPYFLDATVSNFVPDGTAPISDIMKNMTQKGMPHKIATQLLLEAYPELISEIIPPPLNKSTSSTSRGIIETLFGNYFEPKYLRPSLGGLIPPITTIPTFVSSTRKANHQTMPKTNVHQEKAEEKTTIPNLQEDVFTTTTTKIKTEYTRTDLHCEPIANVAVQLAGSKRWTLISPQHMFRLLPSISPDGRAYFASYLKDLSSVPRYTITTHAGDALWIPTWTWHRVDYVQENNDHDVSENDGSDNGRVVERSAMLPISLSPSLFHFRPWDFIHNNPLLAVLVIPNLVKELLGYKTQ